MPIHLAQDNYGESRIRLLRVVRQDGRHDIRGLTLAISFEGDFEPAHSQGDNSKILPADTMKNTVYALARQYPADSVEEFCLHLVEHFLTYNPQVSSVQIEAGENLWTRIPVGAKPHASAFVRGGLENRTVQLRGARDGISIRAGISDLIVLKTTKSAFDGFLRDPYTTLKEERGHILSTCIQADWLYEGTDIEFSPLWHSIRQTMLETFAEHDSKSLQHTLHAMGEAVLNSFDCTREIHLALPEMLFELVDLSPFGMDNPSEVFQPTMEPYGLIQATLRKR